MPSDVDCEKLAWLCLAGNSFKAFLHYEAESRYDRCLADVTITLSCLCKTEGGIFPRSQGAGFLDLLE